MNQRDIDAVLDEVNDAQPVGGNIANLAIGTHTVLLSRYNFKESKKDKTLYVDADFVVLESTAHDEEEVRGWAWFPQAKGWGKTYQSAYLKDFQRAMGDCIGDTRETKEIGRDLCSKQQKGRGTKIKVVVTAQTDRSGNAKSKDGITYTNAKWIPIEQSLADLRECRALLDKMQGTKSEDLEEEQVEKPVEKPAEKPRSGLLAGLKK
jgi:hypothetical protein